jgi:hypothetical protein
MTNFTDNHEEPSELDIETSFTAAQVTCKGPNCLAVNGIGHSPECQAAHDGIAETIDARRSSLDDEWDAEGGAYTWWPSFFQGAVLNAKEDAANLRSGRYSNDFVAESLENGVVLAAQHMERYPMTRRHHQLFKTHGVDNIPALLDALTASDTSATAPAPEVMSGENLADLIPATAVIVESEGRPIGVRMTYAELRLFAKALATSQPLSQPEALIRRVAALNPDAGEIGSGMLAGLVAQPVAVVEAVAEKRAPVQGLTGGIPWWLHLEAYDAYCKRYSPQPALIDLEGRNCRGGFGTSELDLLVPGWRDRISEVGKLRAEVARLTAALAATQTQPAKVDEQKAAPEGAPADARVPLTDEKIEVIGLQAIRECGSTLLNTVVPYGHDLRPMLLSFAEKIQAAQGITPPASPEVKG